MNFIDTPLSGVKIIKPELFQDGRGIFRRNYCFDEFKVAGIDFSCHQGNISENHSKFTLRGFHYQRHPSKESKILTPLVGRIFNVVVDLRHDSPSFLRSLEFIISAKDKESIFVPAGCANAFLTLEDNTIIHYYMGDLFKPESYAGFRYDDPFFNINWPRKPKVISEKDASFSDFSVENI